MRVLILEDEKLAAERLEQLLRDVAPEAEVVALLPSVEAGRSWFAGNTAPDLILSDIRLLDGLSFQLFQEVVITAPVIFTTAYDQYAIRAFEVNSIDYLLKPIQSEKLRLAIEKARMRLQSVPEAQPSFQDLLKMLKSSGPSEYKSRFMVRLGQKIIAVPVEKVAYFFSENKLTFLVTHDQKKYPLDQPLDELVDLLNPQVFFRANRQFIVTFQSIAEIHPYFKGRIKLQLQPATTEEVVISSERSPDFKKWIDQ